MAFGNWTVMASEVQQGPAGSLPPSADVVRIDLIVTFSLISLVICFVIYRFLLCFSSNVGR